MDYDELKLAQECLQPRVDQLVKDNDNVKECLKVKDEIEGTFYKHKIKQVTNFVQTYLSED